MSRGFRILISTPHHIECDGIDNVSLVTSLIRCVSDQLQLFAKEQERKELLFSSAPQTSEPAAAASKAPPPPKSTGKGNAKSKKNQKAGAGGDEDAKEARQTCGDGEAEVGGAALDGGGGKARGKSKAGRKSRGKKGSETEKQPDVPLMQPTPAECEFSCNICNFKKRYDFKKTKSTS